MEEFNSREKSDEKKAFELFASRVHTCGPIITALCRRWAYVSSNTFQVLFLLVPTGVLMLWLLALARFGWAASVFVAGILVATFTTGYCENCSTRGPSALQMFIYIVYDAAVIYALVKAR